MATVTIHDARTNLSKLIRRVEAGSVFFDPMPDDELAAWYGE